MINYKTQRRTVSEFSKPRKSLISETKLDFPDGEYDGVWSAYRLIIMSASGDEIAEVKTTEGIRGVNCLTDLLIQDGLIYELY